VSFKSLVVLVAAAGLAAAGCSSSSKTATPPSSSGPPTTTVAAPGGSYTRPACTPKPSGPVTATKVAGSTSDYDIASFDGTLIRAHWFPVAGSGPKRAPTLLEGPGWGSPGATNASPAGSDLFGGLGIYNLHQHGYNVLTWDPRGFGASGGTIESDSAQYEGRDVQQLIDWIAKQPGVQLDGPGDPRMGMVGASYGGGIQLVTAAIDCRVDALVPQIAWHSLGTSLYKADTVKSGWGNLLYALGAKHKLDAHITSAEIAGNTTGVLSAADRQWFLDRGPADLVGKITAPTLFEQGTVDTLFTLDEAVSNFNILKANGVPTAMLWMCSGHGVCLTDPGDTKRPGDAAIAWVDRYVKDDRTVHIGPAFEYVDQSGASFSADQFPPPASTPITATGAGTLTLKAGGGAGPAHSNGKLGGLGAAVFPITPGRADNAVNVPIPIDATANLVGAPRVTLDYKGTSPAGPAPTRVFAQLVDEASGLVLGNQITPIDVTLDGASHTTMVPIEMVAYTAKSGALLTLQLVATTTAYARPRLGGTINFASVKIEIPTVTGVTKK